WLADARNFPSGLNAALVTAAVWPRNVRADWSAVRSQTRTSPAFPPPPAEARRRPSGLKATARTGSVCPRHVRRSRPVAAARTRRTLTAPRRGDAVAALTERHAAHPAAVPAQGVDLPARRDVPDAHRPVRAPRRQAFAVRAERHGRHPERVAGEGEDLLAGGRVPDPHLAWRGWGHLGKVPGARGEVLAVGAEGHAVGPLRQVGEAEQLLARVGVPDLHLAARPPPAADRGAAGRRQPPAVRAEGHPLDQVVVGADAPQLLAAGR